MAVWPTFRHSVKTFFHAPLWPLGFFHIVFVIPQVLVPTVAGLSNRKNIALVFATNKESASKTLFQNKYLSFSIPASFKILVLLRRLHEKEGTDLSVATIFLLLLLAFEIIILMFVSLHLHVDDVLLFSHSL